MLIHSWQTSIIFLDLFLDMWQVRQTERIASPEDDMVHIIDGSAVRKEDSACLWIELGDLLLYSHMRMFPRNETKGWNWRPTQGRNHRVFRKWQDFMDDL